MAAEKGLGPRRLLLLERLARQGEEQQEMVGAEYCEAWQAGAYELDDLIAYTPEDYPYVQRLKSLIGDGDAGQQA